MLFTFIIEMHGETLIEQIRAIDVNSAVLAWEKESILNLLLENRHEEAVVLPVPVKSCNNVWCYSVIDDKNMFYLVHIVLTAI